MEINILWELAINPQHFTRFIILRMLFALDDPINFRNTKLLEDLDELDENLMTFQ